MITAISRELCGFTPHLPLGHMVATGCHCDTTNTLFCNRLLQPADARWKPWVGDSDEPRSSFVRLWRLCVRGTRARLPMQPLDSLQLLNHRESFIFAASSLLGLCCFTPRRGESSGSSTAPRSCQQNHSRSLPARSSGHTVRAGPARGLRPGGQRGDVGRRIGQQPCRL